MTIPLSIEGMITPEGEVTNITVGADNPRGVITPFGVVTIMTDASQVQVGGTITPVGEVTTSAIDGCFDTEYECIEADSTPDYDCVGSCEEPPPVAPPPGECPECPECPDCEECEDCDECEECEDCPSVFASECNDIIRVLFSKIIAWHIADCGFLVGGDGGVGVVWSESFETYADLDAVQAGGWVLVDTHTNGSWGGIDPALAYHGSKSFYCSFTGKGGHPTLGVLSATKTIGVGVGVQPDSPYYLRGRARMNSRPWYDHDSKIQIVGSAITKSDHIQGTVGTWEELQTTSVDSGPGASLDIKLLRYSGWATASTLWFDNLEVIGPVAGGPTIWTDQSGNNNHLEHVDGNRPTLNGALLAGVNTVKFNNAYMVWPTDMLSGVGTFEAFVVVKSTSGSGLWMLGHPTADPTLFPDSVTGKIFDSATSVARQDFGIPSPSPVDEFIVYHIKGDAANVAASINDVLMLEAAHVFSLTDNPQFGRSSASVVGNLDVAELLLTIELTDDERANTLEILLSRWGLA